MDNTKPVLGEEVKENDRHSYVIKYVPVRELNYWDKNPRKISPKKLKELYDSLKESGEGSIITIDEENAIIGGNHRVKALKEYEPDAVVLCRQILGRTFTEKAQLNIKLNQHKSEWDFDVLAELTKLAIGVDDVVKKAADMEESSKNKLLEPLPFERHDFFVIACSTEGEIAELEHKMGLKDTFTKLHKSNGRKMKTRAIWYKDRKFEIVPKEDK